MLPEGVDPRLKEPSLSRRDRNIGVKPSQWHCKLKFNRTQQLILTMTEAETSLEKLMAKSEQNTRALEASDAWVVKHYVANNTQTGNHQVLKNVVKNKQEIQRRYALVPGG